MNKEKLIIIGGGPAAWSAAVYASRAAFAPLVLTGDSPGGQLMLTTEVENFPGFDKGIDGPVLMDQMQQQAVRFGTKVVNEKVTRIEPREKSFKVVTERGEYEAAAVIVATGAQARWLKVKGEKDLVGRGVSACAVCDAAFFKGKETIVVGGGDAAMEDALAVARFASRVTLIHRRDKFRASKTMIERVTSKENIRIWWNSAIEEIRGEGKVKEVVVKNLIEGQSQVLSVDGVFVAIGHEPATSFLRGTVDLDEAGYVITGLTLGGPEMWRSGYPTMTNVAGIFAGGDCVDYRYRQASTAVGFGVMAALDAERYLEALTE